MESGLRAVGILIINGMLYFAALHRSVCRNGFVSIYWCYIIDSVKLISEYSSMGIDCTFQIITISKFRFFLEDGQLF